MKRNLLVLFTVIGLFCLFISNTSFAGRNLQEVDDYELSTFSVSEYGLTISYPKNWIFKENDPKSGKIFLCESPESYLFEIHRAPIKEGETLNQYTDAQGDWLSENYDNYEEKALYRDKTLGDKMGNLRIYTYTYKGNSYEVSEFYFKAWNNDFYVVLFDTPEGSLEKNKRLFEILVEGIKHTESIIKLKEFVSPNSDFVIKYPSDWKLIPPIKDLVFKAIEENNVSIQVLVHKLPANLSIEQYVKISGEWLKKNLRDYKENYLDPYISKDSSLKGFVREYKYTSDGETKYALEYYFNYKLEDKNKGFTVIFTMPEGLDDKYVDYLRKIQKRIIDSFKLIYG